MGKNLLPVLRQKIGIPDLKRRGQEIMRKTRNSSCFKKGAIGSLYI